MKWIVISGNLDEGFTFIGPFDAYTNASDYIDNDTSDNVMIIAALADVQHVDNGEK